jgi:hypothetical protein
MKRIEHEVERNGDRVIVKALWRDTFKKPASVRITTEKHETPMARVLIDADVRVVRNTLNGIAQIAWDMGWRPLGLGPVLARIVETYKEPKIEV